METAICSNYKVIYLFKECAHPSTNFVKEKIIRDRILSIPNYHSSYKHSFKINYNHISSGLSQTTKFLDTTFIPPTIPQLLVTLDSIPPTNPTEVSAR